MPDNGRDSGLPVGRVWGVGALVQAVGDTLAARFGQCLVRGEISGFTRAASGHGYFTLKDEHGQASLRCAMFRRALSQLDLTPGEGMLVEVRGRLAVYEARGELQLVVEDLRRAGAGALFEQFLRLKAKLEAEGVFDPSRKKPLAAFPRRIGLVTSSKGAAVHDVLTALARRAPHVEVVLFPSAVQGLEAPAQLVDAMARAGLAHRQGYPMDALVVCRGGGSLEDLWAFNDERVVRAIAASPLPVVVGVGHETDVTLADLAADLRAPTPTAAAELVAQDRGAALAALDGLQKHLQRRVEQRLDNVSQRLDRCVMHLLKPAQLLARQGRTLDMLAHRLSGAGAQRLSRARQALPPLRDRLVRAGGWRMTQAEAQWAAVSARLSGVDPRLVLERGYAWLQQVPGGAPVTRVGQAHAGEVVQAVMSDGRLLLRVDSIEQVPPKTAGDHGPD